MRIYLEYLIILCTVFISCSQKGKLELIPIKKHFYVDTLNSIHQSYIVKNFTNNLISYKTMDSVFCETKKANINTNRIFITFYKESKYTNLSEIEKSDDVLYDYSTDNDRIYVLQYYGDHIVTIKPKNNGSDILGSLECK